MYTVHLFNKNLQEHDMIEIGTVEKAKYPFLPDAGRYLQDKGFTIEDFGRDPDLQKVVEKACRRIKVAAEGGIYRSQQASDEYALDMEVFSFLLCIVLLKLCRSGALVNKFVMAESRRAQENLERDLKAMRAQDEALAVKIISDLFSVDISKKGKDFVISVANYVRRSIFFHEMPWKLVNRRVSGGMVFLTAHEVIRLIRQQLTVYIGKRIRAAGQPPMLPNFEEQVKELDLLAQKFRPTSVIPTDFPPCIKHAIKELDAGKNLPHSGRFMLASFMVRIGKSTEELVPLFKNAPDYNERVTRYQLEQIAGGGSRSTGYNCPSCSKIKSNDLCFATEECSGITNPLQFGRGQPVDA